MTYAERWSYMPIAALIGWGAVIFGNREYRIQNARIRFTILNSLFFILLSSLITRNVVRQFDWKDGLTLYGSDVRFAQQSFDLENNYGVELMRAGRVDEAKIHFERSMQLSPYWWTPPNNLGVIYQRQGDLEKAKALYRLAISNGDYYLAYENLAAILVQEDDPEAVVVVEAGLARFPYNRNLLEMAFYLSRK
jgi:tetratricopeptide (TPR) repeat protein